MVISCDKIFLLISKYLSLWSWPSMELAIICGICVSQTHLVYVHVISPWFDRGGWDGTGQRSEGSGAGQEAGFEHQHAEGTTRGAQRGTHRDTRKYTCTSTACSLPGIWYSHAIILVFFRSVLHIDSNIPDAFDNETWKLILNLKYWDWSIYRYCYNDEVLSNFQINLVLQ